MLVMRRSKFSGNKPVNGYKLDAMIRLGDNIMLIYTCIYVCMYLYVCMYVC